MTGHRTFVTLMILEITIVYSQLSNNAIVQYLHNSTIYQMVMQKSGLGETQIVVGKYPVDDTTNTVFVANSGSDSVFVIDYFANKVVAGVKFHVNPFNSGSVECDELSSSISQYFYLWSGPGCKAKPNNGYVITRPKAGSLLLVQLQIGL